MSATLTLGTSVISFDPETPSYTELKSEIQRETLGGYRRTTLLWRKYQYTMELEPISVAAYNAIRDMWVSAISTGVYPLFDFSAWWPDANGIAVAITLGPHTTLMGGNIGKASLMLAEVLPR